MSAHRPNLDNQSLTLAVLMCRFRLPIFANDKSRLNLSDNQTINTTWLGNELLIELQFQVGEEKMFRTVSLSSTPGSPGECCLFRLLTESVSISILSLHTHTLKLKCCSICRSGGGSTGDQLGRGTPSSGSQCLPSCNTGSDRSNSTIPEGVAKSGACDRGDEDNHLESGS